MSKAAFSIDQFCDVYSVGKTTVYEEIKAGRLQAVKARRRTLITAEAAKAWRDALPLIEPHLTSKSRLEMVECPEGTRIRLRKEPTQ